MNISHMQAKFIEAIDIFIGELTFRFTHDYGEVALPWDSITHAFIVKGERQTAAPLPFFVMVSSSSDCFYCLDGNSVSMKTFDTEIPTEDSPPEPQERTAEDSPPEPQERTAEEVQKQKEQSFRKILEEICSRLARAVFDEPLSSYLKGGQMSVPEFSELKDVAAYCVTAMNSLASHAKDEPVISKAMERPVKGMLLDGKFTIIDIVSTATQIFYKVLDPDTQEYFMIRTIAEKYRRDSTIINLFLNQARIWTKLGSHPNLQKAELVKNIDGLPHLFTEFIQGTDLEKLTKKEALSPKSAIEVGIQICDGLDHAFRQSGCPHRDLKLSHCIITGDDVLKLADFGQARIYDEFPFQGPLSEKCRHIDEQRITINDFPLYGSIPYMAPELFTLVDAAGVRSDVYSFGVIMYSLFTGINPFAGGSPSTIMSNHLSQMPVSPQKFNPLLPEPLALLVLKCIRKDPSQRYGDFSQISSLLRYIYHEMTGSPYLKPEIEKFMGEDYWINDGLSQKSVNLNEEAIEAFDQALRYNPASLRARFHRGSSLSRRISEGLRGDQESPELWFWKGESHRKKGEHGEALMCFDRALSINAREATLWAQKARVLADMENYEEALKCYDGALYYNPRAIEIWDDRGSLLLKMNNYRAAIDCFRESLECSPKFKWALFHEGIALFNLGRHREAIDVLQKVIDQDPGFYPAWVRMGDCYRESEKRSEAINAYKSAMNLEKNTLDAYLLCIQTLKEEGKWEEALELVKRAEEIQPADATLTLDYGEILLKLSYYGESRAFCEKMLKEDPENEDAQLLLRTASRFEKEQNALFDAIFSAPPIPRESISRDLNSLLSVFCSVKDALSHMESITADDASTAYLKGCLYYIDSEFDKALAQSLKALEDSQIKDKAQKLKERIEACLDTQGPAKKKDIFGFAKTLWKKESGTPDELLITGFEKMKGNDFQDARQYLKDTIAKNPTLYSCVYLLALTYTLENDREKASHYYNELARLVPLSIGCWKERVARRLNSKAADMEQTYQKLLGSYPYSPDIWMEYLKFLSLHNHEEKLRIIASGLLRESFKEWGQVKESAHFFTVLGFLNLCLGRFKGAQEFFSKALEFDGENMPALMGMGKCHEGRQLFEEALEHFKNLLVREETFGVASYIMSDIFLRHTQELKALGTIDEALEKNPDFLPFMYKKAQVYAQLKMFPELDDSCSRILSLDGTCTPVRVLLCNALVEQRESRDAIDEISRVFSYDKENIVALRNSGFMSVQARDFEKALSIFKDIIDLYPMDYEAHMGLGIIYYIQKNYDSALECFQKALELDPQEPYLWLYLGAAHFHLGHFPESGKCWESAFVHKSGFTLAWINKGAFLYQRGKYPQSEECVDVALGMEPHTIFALIIKVGCQWKMGHLEKAAESIREATRIETRSAKLWYNRALLELHLRNYGDAKESLERALEINGDFAEASLAIFALSRCTEGEGVDSCLLQKIELKYSHHLDAWKQDFEMTGNLLSYLKPVEIQEDPFTLPLMRPLSHVEPIGLFHLLNFPVLKARITSKSS